MEVIVVDDGSTSWRHLLDPFHGRIHILGKANEGTASALNHGMRLASGKYVAWLSSDDWFYPEKIAHQVSFMEQAGLRMSCTDYHIINERNEMTAMHQALRFPSPKAYVASLLSLCPVNGCTVMMTRELIAGLGWFNEAYPYAHDYELWIRAALSGIDMHFVDLPLTLYRRHSGMGTVRHRHAVAAEFESIRAYYGYLLHDRIARTPG